MEELRNQLHLNEEPWFDLPDDLLQLAFRNKSVRLSRGERGHLMSKYKGFNLERFEFVGDAVLQLVASELVFETTNAGPGLMTQVRSNLVRNSTLQTLMEQAHLCDWIETERGLKAKDCADTFEAILGVMYCYIKYRRPDLSAVDSLRDWLRRWWFTNDRLHLLYDGQALTEVESLSDQALRALTRERLREIAHRLDRGEGAHRLLETVYQACGYNLNSNIRVIDSQTVVLREPNLEQGGLVEFEFVTALNLKEAKEQASLGVLERLLNFYGL